MIVKPGYLLAVLLLLPAYLSLYPFHWVNNGVSGFQLAALWQGSLWTNLSDVLSNLLMFAPAGLIAAWLPGDRWRTSANEGAQASRLSIGYLAVIIAVTLSFCLLLQWAQLGLESRQADIADAVWNGAGFVVALLLGASYPAPLWVRRFSPKQGVRVPALLLLWVAAHTYPWIPDLNLNHWVSSVALLKKSSLMSLTQLFWQCFCLLAAGELLRVAGVKSRRWLPLAAMLLLVSRPAMDTLYLDWSRLLGWSMAIPLWFLLFPAHRELRLRLLIIFGSASFLLMSFAPFITVVEPARFDWRPWSALLQGHGVMATQAIMLRLFALGFLLWAWRRLGVSRFTVAAMLLVAVILIEWAQRWLLWQTPSITEPLLFGMGLVFWLRRDWRRPVERSAWNHCLHLAGFGAITLLAMAAVLVGSGGVLALPEGLSERLMGDMPLLANEPIFNLWALCLAAAASGFLIHWQRATPRFWVAAPGAISLLALLWFLVIQAALDPRLTMAFSQAPAMTLLLQAELLTRAMPIIDLPGVLFAVHRFSQIWLLAAAIFFSLAGRKSSAIVAMCGALLASVLLGFLDPGTAFTVGIGCVFLKPVCQGFTKPLPLLLLAGIAMQLVPWPLLSLAIVLLFALGFGGGLAERLCRNSVGRQWHAGRHADYLPLTSLPVNRRMVSSGL